jgi:uncharacterized SAM-binding protein YcdF (DUF218 family)
MPSLPRTLATAAALVLVAWGAVAATLDAAGERRPPARDGARYAAVVVAGCRVLPDGAASSCLRLRTEAAVALWQQGVADTLVLTGGVGTYPPSEAEAAARIARALGVPEHALVLEDRSTSTEENAHFAALELGTDARVLVVTDAWHTHRVRRVFDRHFAGADAVGVDGPLDRRARGAMREVLAVVYYGLRGRL